MRRASVLVAVCALVIEGAPLPAQAGRDSIVYHLSPASRLEVKTGKAGLFGFAGHEHTIRATGFSGRVVYFPDSPRSSRVEVRIATDSLEVMTPPDTEEIRKVTEAMRGKVLHVDRFPEILFAGRTISASDEAFRMFATLTLRGETRTFPIDVQVTALRDTIRATSTFSIKQS